MPVRSPEGLVGRDDRRRGDRFARPAGFRPRQHRARAAAARRTAGHRQGRGDGTIDVRPLEVGRNPFKRGDIIITSGTGGLYPPLVPVARIVRLDDDGAIAVPLADPGDDQLRHRRAAVRAAGDRRGHGYRGAADAP